MERTDRRARPAWALLALLALVALAVACTAGKRQTETPAACAEGVVSAPCTCGGTTRTSGYCCAGTWQAGTCGAPSACAEGAVTTPCTCGGATRTTGFCCSNVWQSTACGAPSACAEGAITTPCTCGGATRTTGFCCSNAWQTTACGAPSACGEGAITTPCTCGGATQTSGYCCSNAWQAVACGPPPTGDLIPADRITAWNPGILVDDQLGLPLGQDGLPVRATVCATLSPGQNIQTAINNCTAGQVVLLNAGIFTVSSTINLKSGVVLRGSGSQGAPTGTTIVKTGGQTVLAIGTDRDGTCYGGTGQALTQNVAKESTTLAVGSNASVFSVGDLALVDQVDDSSVQQGDCNYYKRVSGRSVSQRVEVKAVNTGNGTLTVASPLHWNFKFAAPYRGEVTRVTQPVTRWAGIEHLKIQGGTNPDYNGAMAGGIDISNAAYCWVKDVQTDGTIGGMHISLTGTYRCVVRDSNIHHSANYGFGADCYGIVMRCGSSETLVENNIVRWMNKPVLFDSTGGGNVVAYNYVDNSWAEPTDWQEVNIDCHCAFPHMELIEGNFAPHVGATTTHGNTGYLTFFRNFHSSQFAPPYIFGSTDPQVTNITAFQFQAGDIGMNIVGNVLGTDGVSNAYETQGNDNYDNNTIYRLGGASDVSTTTLLRHGNWDTVNHATQWAPGNAVRTLPASLYRSAKPAWWPAGTPWPWAGSDLTPMVGTLPAKARSDALGP